MAVLPHKWPWRSWPVDELPKEIPRYLANTEVTVLGGQIHEAVMIFPVTSFVGGTLGVFLAFAQLPSDATAARNLLALLWFGLLLWVIWRWFEWTRDLIFITGNRLIKVHGIIIRKVAMMPIGKVTDMSYVKTPGGILLGYGEFIVESAGQDQALRDIKYVPDPDNTYRHIQNLLFSKSTQNVNIVDISTAKRLSVSWTGRFRKHPDGRTGVVEQDEETPPW